MAYYTNLTMRVNSLKGDDSAWEGTTPEQHHIDFRYLQQVTLSDESLANEVLDLFSRQISIYLIDLKNSQTREDLMYVAHTIKGASRSIGAFDLSELSTTIERETLYPSTPDTNFAIARIDKEIGLVLEEVEAFKKNHRVH